MMTPADNNFSRILREIAAIKRELKAIRSLINADTRTADRLIPASEACKILGCKKSHIYRLISSGQLPARKDENGRYKISFNQLQRYIRS